MTANLLIRALDEPKTFSVEAASLAHGYTNIDISRLATPYAADGSKMRIAASIKPTADLDANTIMLRVRTYDSAGKHNWSGVFAPALTANVWTRFSADITVPSGMTIHILEISVYNNPCTFDVMDFELWDGTDATKAVASHTPYATEGHLQEKYASQEQLSSVSSQFTQTAQGFNASITTVTKALDDATGRISELKNLSDNMIGENGTFTKFYNSATSYMKFEYDENLKDSYLVLGQTDSTLSLRIGNDRIEFMDGPNVIAYVDGDKLFINNVQVVKRHMIADLEKNHGGFVFDTRENGNMCVRWITG